MSEEHRTLARKVTIGIVGLPVGVGMVVVGWQWVRGEGEEEGEGGREGGRG